MIAGYKFATHVTDDVASVIMPKSGYIIGCRSTAYQAINDFSVIGNNMHLCF
jgi:hypothetical protein